MGLPATGRDVTIAGLVISRFRGGKVVEEWEASDVFGLMQQIGAIPEMAQS
jgi:predicted ester cyclase